MASSSDGLEARRLLPPAAAAFLRRRAGETAGLVLLALAAALAAALYSYSPADPSLNAATGRPAVNLLGRPGAAAADLLLQSLGLASGLVVVLGAAWGWLLLCHRSLKPLWLKATLLPVALLAAAAALSLAPVPPGWPLRAPLGGFAGHLVAGHLIALVPPGLGLPAGGLVAGFSGLLALAATLWSLGLSLGDWMAVARGAGQGVAFGLRTTARAGALGGAAARAGYRFARERAEPRLSAPRLGRAEPTIENAPPAEEAEPEVMVALRAPRREARVEKPAAATPGRRAAESRQASLALNSGEYQPPPLTLLAKPTTKSGRGIDQGALEQNARLLESVLQDFGVKGEIVKVRPGPVVTLYELEPAPGTKSARVIGLADDIARSMSAVSVRVAVVPGRNVIGIELPNVTRETVYLRELLASETFERAGAKLGLALGKDIGGAPVIVDLARMPHLLIAGTTGSGKSVAINTMILSLLYRLPPDRCRFIMIDPKMLELSTYDGIPHLLAPVVTDPRKAIVALKWTVREMEGRYRAMSKLGVRNIEGYNQRLAEARAKGEVLKRRVQTGFDSETGRPVYEDEILDLNPLPYIVVVIDEMADLMLVAGKDIEAAVQRLAQMARAAGIHVVMATQRPSVDVITGTIKANFPTRVSFQVTSKIDSRTILGEQGAEQLLGQGDMLYMAGGGRITRVHGPFCSDEEVEEVVRHLRKQGEPEYLEAVTEDEEEGPGAFGEDGDAPSGVDELYQRAVELVTRERKASTSFVQRHLQIGYNRAARIIEQMEAEGLVGQPNHVGKREVLVGER